MEKRNLLRQIPKKSVKIKEEKQDKMLDESEVFKTNPKHDLEVVPVSTETVEKVVEEVVEPPKKKKKVFPRIDCPCGVNIGANMVHIHKKQKRHVEWLESQKEKPQEPKKDVEVEKISVSVPEESETKKQEIVKPKQINQPFQIDYDRIINGVSQNYINYKKQKHQIKQQQKPVVDDYKTKYEKLLEEQEKNKKKQQANMYLYRQNQAFGRAKRGGGWFS